MKPFFFTKNIPRGLWMESVEVPRLEKGLKIPNGDTGSPSPVLALDRWKMTRSLVSSGTVNLQIKLLSDAFPKSKISDEILTVVTRYSRLFFTGIGASSMPNIRATLFPKSVCKKLEPDHVRLFSLYLQNTKSRRAHPGSMAKAISPSFSKWIFLTR